MAFLPETPQSAPQTVPANDYLNVVGTYPLAGEMASNRIILYFDRPLALTQYNWNQRISIQPSVSG
ncbi:MAG: hypothetical protein RBU29_14420, partial [bacterium]|nr:hypothetical protein [bacterium]